MRSFCDTSYKSDSRSAQSSKRLWRSPAERSTREGAQQQSLCVAKNRTDLLEQGRTRAAARPQPSDQAAERSD
eukprot:scaffold274186_cov28-Tisochrysis_lutea.AAC.3